MLAAGSSTRMHQPKQSLPYQGTTLLQHSLQAALAAEVYPVILVAGAGTNLVLPGQHGLRVVYNHEQKEGLAASIRTGLAELRREWPDRDRVILMVCDQPHVTPELLNSLIAAGTPGHIQIVACAYKDTVGTPVLFKNTFYDELAALNGDEGAKKIVLHHRDQTAVIPFPQGEIDIDTMADYQALLSKQL